MYCSVKLCFQSGREGIWEGKTRQRGDNRIYLTVFLSVFSTKLHLVAIKELAQAGGGFWLSNDSPHQVLSVQVNKMNLAVRVC